MFQNISIAILGGVLMWIVWYTRPPKDTVGNHSEPLSSEALNRIVKLECQRGDIQHGDDIV